LNATALCILRRWVSVIEYLVIQDSFRISCFEFGCGYAALSSSATICGICGHVFSTQSVQSVKSVDERGFGCGYAALWQSV